MKNIFFFIIALIAVLIITVSCNQSSNKNTEPKATDPISNSETQNLPSTQNDTSSSVVPIDTTAKKVEQQDVQNFSIAPIVKDYLALKNALVADNDKAAASAGKQLFSTLKNVDMKAIPANKYKEYVEIAENAKENAEHIGDNAGEIDHQREHLASLSKDVSDLIVLFGTKQKLYQDYCPMYNEGKGAIWISEAKEIKNPYYGKKMLTCGSVKKEL